MTVGNVVGMFGHPKMVGFVEDLGVGAAGGGVEFVTGEFVALAEGVTEIDGVHEAPVYFAGVGDAAVVEPFFGFDEGGTGDGEGDVVEEAGFFGVRGGVYFAVLVGEDGDESAVARIKIEMTFLFPVQIRLLEDEGHAQNAFPKVNGRLPRRPNNGDVMNPLSRNFFHVENLLYLVIGNL